MQRFDLFFSQTWYLRMSSWERELVQTSVELFSREERLRSSFSDYSFIVFPMAKAYEGFLKRCFFDFQLISLATYADKHFRIGRALNPDIHPNRRDDNWVYGRLASVCGTETARSFWDAWLECRNQVFHYFPQNEKRLSLQEAGNCIERLAIVMERAASCKRHEI